MPQEFLTTFVLITAVFLAGASIGRLLLRVRLARLEGINMRLDQKRLAALARTWQARAVAFPESRHEGFEREVRNEIDAILSEIEQP